MAFLASTAAVSLRAPLYLASSSRHRRRPLLPTAVKATASSGSGSASASPHPVLSSLRLAASAAVLLAATSPAVACVPSTPPPTPAAVTATVSADDAAAAAAAAAAADESHPFEKLVVETAALARSGGADTARARLSSAASGGGESCARLLAAQALFVDGNVDGAIAALEELAREDPADYRPLFCQAVLYAALGRGAEADSMLERCRELAGHEFGADLTMLISPADAAVEDTDAESGAQKPEAEAQAEPELVKV